MTLYSLRLRMRSWGRKRASPFTRSIVCDPWPAFASERGVRSSCSSGPGSRVSSCGGGCSAETCASWHLLRCRKGGLWTRRARAVKKSRDRSVHRIEDDQKKLSPEGRRVLTASCDAVL